MKIEFNTIFANPQITASPNITQNNKQNIKYNKTLTKRHCKFWS